MEEVNGPSPAAAAEMLPLVYDELKRLATQRMARESPGQTLQATALVHEAYLRLTHTGENPRWENRAHFFGAAAEAMRRILIDIKCTDQEKGILDPRFIPALAHALGNSALPAEDVSVICFHRHVIAECREKLPDHEAIWLIDPRKRPPLEEIQAGLMASGASGIGFPAHPEVARDPGLRAAIRILGDQGFSLLCWTLEDQNEGKTALQFVGLGTGIVVTKNIEKVRTALTGQAGLELAEGNRNDHSPHKAEVRESAIEKQ